jgi:hypothetical protein|eukprot:COSAG03_NODE_787_length_5862_cov_14.468680_6_plen_97_part_00
MRFAVTPASGKNVYTVPSPPSNTWNGPIVGPESDGLYHIYVPLYQSGSLGGAKQIKHGLATHPAGPYLLQPVCIAPLCDSLCLSLCLSVSMSYSPG